MLVMILRWKMLKIDFVPDEMQQTGSKYFCPKAIASLRVFFMVLLIEKIYFTSSLNMWFDTATYENITEMEQS